MTGKSVGWMVGSGMWRNIDLITFQEALNDR